MIRTLVIATLASVFLSSCGTVRETVPKGPVAQFLFPERGPITADSALEAYYDTIPDSALPLAPVGKSLPATDAILTRILVGSCANEETANPALAQMARERADLMLSLIHI